jgi:hypothetical protein
MYAFRSQFLVIGLFAIFSCRNHEETLLKVKSIEPEDILSVKILSVYKGGCLGSVHFYLQSKDFQPLIQAINSYTGEDIITSTKNVALTELYEIVLKNKEAICFEVFKSNTYNGGVIRFLHDCSVKSYDVRNKAILNFIYSVCR